MAEADGVAFQADHPFSWDPLPETAPHEVAAWMHTNTVLLRALATLEAAIPPTEPDADLPGPASRALERLEAKTDLVLELLGVLLCSRAEALPPRPATLSATSLEWDDSAGPENGSLILIRLAISPALPHPLRLPARVERQGTTVRASFAHLTDEALDWLERTVFRRHRRQIQALAQQRQQAG